MKLAIVIWEDRHIDTDVYPFSSAEAAINYAREKAHEMLRDVEELDEELSEGMRRDGWLYYGQYSEEGDCLRVIERELDAQLENS